MFYYGYNTNGLAHHDLFDALSLLADLGYRGIGLTIDHALLSPRTARTSTEQKRLHHLLKNQGIHSVIETGARFLLDPRHKHEPTLLSANPQPRIDFYKYAIDCAAYLESDCVSLFSGILHRPLSHDAAMDLLLQSLGELLDYAAKRGVLIAFEPEPGMFIDTLDRFAELKTRLNHKALKLTLDIGHAHCQNEGTPENILRQWIPDIVNIHIEDMRRGIHEHLFFGQGEIDFPLWLNNLAAFDYNGGLYVELSRHSHEAPEAAQKALAFLIQNSPHPP